MKEQAEIDERGGQIYQKGLAAKFIDDCLAGGRVCFVLDELKRETGLSPVAAVWQVRRLAPRVVQVYPRSSFYLIVPPEHRVNGAPPVTWWIDDFFRYLGKPYYVALLSAAAEHGSAHQAVQVTQVMTDGHRDDISVGRLRIHFFTKKDAGKTPAVSPRGAYAPFRVSAPEATVLDLIRYEAKLGGIDRVIEVIDEMRPMLTPTGLKTALSQDLAIKLLQRAGFIFDRLNMSALCRLVRARLAGERLQPAPLAVTITDEDLDNEWLVRRRMKM